MILSFKIDEFLLGFSLFLPDLLCEISIEELSNPLLATSGKDLFFSLLVPIAPCDVPDGGFGRGTFLGVKSTAFS